MNLNDVQAWVKEIEEGKADDEAAHHSEDRLYRHFILHVAEHGPADLAEMAKEALKTRDIDFSRWYA